MQTVHCLAEVKSSFGFAWKEVRELLQCETVQLPYSCRTVYSVHAERTGASVRSLQPSSLPALFTAIMCALYSRCS